MAKECHNTLIVGLTRHGKTHGTIQEIKRSKRGALFIKPGKPLKAGFVVADLRNSPGQILEGIKRGHKIEYRIPDLSRGSEDELIYLIDQLMAAGFKESRPINFVIDEVPFFARYKAGREKLETLARMGIQHGLNTYFISQRFADAPYTVMTQCKEVRFYLMGDMERDYVKSKGFDFDRIMAGIHRKGKYSYMIHDAEKGLLGPFKE